jgi:hypothetical protein
MAHKKGSAARSLVKVVVPRIMPSAKPEVVCWQLFDEFLQLIGRNDPDEPLVVAVFPKTQDQPNIHFGCTAGSIPRVEIEKTLRRKPSHSLGLVINPALPKPKEWGTLQEHLTKSGRPRQWGAKNEHIAGARLIWYEADGGLPKVEQLAAIRRAGLPEPDFIVDTSGKSLHSYWRLDEPITPEQFRDLMQRLPQAVDALTPEMRGDTGIHNPCRVMRAPGGLHPSGNRCTIWRAPA